MIIEIHMCVCVGSGGREDYLIALFALPSNYNSVENGFVTAWVRAIFREWIKITLFDAREGKIDLNFSEVEI